MLSEKAKSLYNLLDLWATGINEPKKEHVILASFVALDIWRQAKLLEAAQIQPSQKVQDDDFASGKVVRLPVVHKTHARPA